MTTWQNWSGLLRDEPKAIHLAYGEDDIAARLADASAQGETLRVVGSGHSHATLIPGADHLLDMSALAGVISADTKRRSAWVWSATPIKQLGPALHQHGLALPNQGDIDQQQIIGAISTGTHGTGPSLTNLSALVTGLKIVTSNGEVTTCNRDQQTDLFAAAQLGLGAVGVITQVELALNESYRLSQGIQFGPWPELAPEVEQRIDSHRHFEFFWYPKSDKAMAKWTDLTDEPARYPIADEGQRVGWSFEVLPNHRPHKHSEMEYSVSADQGRACFDAIRELMRRDFPDTAWPVEYRTLAADQVWLSTAFERPTVTISVHEGTDKDARPLFDACETVFKQFDGRPHWGKVHTLNGTELAHAHPNWTRWWQVRDAADPSGTLLNPWLASVRPT